MSKKCELEVPTKEKIEWVRSQLGTSEEDIEVAIAVLREWLKQQPHLPQVIDDCRLEKMYISCKCSLERTKRTLDAYYSLKERMPELLMKREPIRTLPYVKHAPMPRMTPGGYRVWVLTVAGCDTANFDLSYIFRRAFMWIEMMLVEDYSIGDILVADLKDLPLSQVLRWDAGRLRNIVIAYENAYNRRLKALHLLNASRILDAVLRFLKLIFSEKLQKRIVVHTPGSRPSEDEVPKECLPEELGGTAGSMHEIENALADKIEKYRDWLLEQDHYVTDESLRPNKMRTVDDIFGVSGSFKKLTVD